MKNKKISTVTPETIIENYTFPMISLLFDAGISSFYNYLPGKESDDENLAWVYYYLKLDFIHDFICRTDFGSNELKERFHQLWEDVRHMIVSCEGASSMPSYWYDASPVLREAAFDLYSEDEEISTGLIEAFIALSLELLPDEGKELLKGSLSGHELSFRPFEDEEIDFLRLSAWKLRRDESTRCEEIRWRKKLLERYLGITGQAPLSEEAILIRKKIERKTGYTVYHVIEDRDRIVFLCLTYEVLYWENQRPASTGSAVYAFGCIMERGGSYAGNFGQIRL